MARKISERLSPSDVAKYEATRYSGNQKLVDRIEQRQVRELLHAAAGSRTDLKVVDVPCGYGRFTAALLEVGGTLVDADRSDTMAARARDQARAMGVGSAESAVVDIRALPFADRSFDLVLSMRLLHHLFERADRDAMFRELHRITRDQVVISYYDRTPIHRIQRKLSGVVKKKRRNSRIFFFGTDAFTEEAQAAGFAVEEIRTPLPLVHAQRLARLRRVR